MTKFTVGALAVIVDKDGRILLVKKNYDNMGWQLPGGFLEEGESAQHALKRELREELDLSIDGITLAGIYHKVYENNLSIVFYCDRVTGNPTPDRKEISEVTYFESQALPKQLSARSRLVIRDCLSRPTIPLVWSFSAPETLIGR